MRKRQIAIIVCILAGAFAVTKIFELSLVSTLILTLAGSLMFPILAKNHQAQIREKNRFLEVNLYMEQLLYAFQKNPMVLTALTSVYEMLSENSAMKDVVKRAMEHIQYDYEDVRVTENALKLIEKEYNCQRIRDVHRLLLKTEQIGGEYHSSVKILLKDRAVWETQICKFQQDSRTAQRNTRIAIVLSAGACMMTPFMKLFGMQQFDITGVPLYHISTTIFFLILMWIYVKADQRAVINWLERENPLSHEQMIILYEKVAHYDHKQARKKSFAWAVCPCLIFFFCIWKKHWIGMFLSFFLMSFCLLQHKTDYYLAKKRMTHELSIAFPQWLMEMSLLLQTENVQVAIQKSAVDAPGILVRPLEQLQEELRIYPESNEPYMNFLREFEVYEIPSAMGMLYSIAAGSGGNSWEQMDEILERNTELVGKAEELANRDRMASLNVLLYEPALFGALKMVVDAGIMMVVFLSVPII